MRFVTSRVQLRIQRICPHLPTSPKTSSPVTTTAMSSLLLMWSVLTLCCAHRRTSDSLSKITLTYLILPFYQNLAYEIILTLGQAFEVAYQLALQARKSGHGSSTLPESFDSKPSKPVPKPRINIRKSVSNAAAQLHYCSKKKSIPVKFHNSEATCSRWSGLDCFGLKWKSFKFFEFHSNKALLFSLDSVHNTLPVSSSLIYIISKHLRLVF